MHEKLKWVDCINGILGLCEMASMLQLYKFQLQRCFVLSVLSVSDRNHYVIFYEEKSLCESEQLKTAKFVRFSGS